MINLQKATRTYLLLFLAVLTLYFLKSFLTPLAIAGLLAMLFTPLCRKIEAKGGSRVLSGILSVVILLSVVAGIVTLISWQISSLSEDASQIEHNITQTAHEVQRFVTSSLGISRSKQNEITNGDMPKKAMGLIGQSAVALPALFLDLLLLVVYFLLLLLSRGHIRNFILKATNEGRQEKANLIINQSVTVAYKYFAGLGLMIVMLWIMYGIGFSIIGVKNAVFFAILCGILEIIPFVGNITGTGLTVLMVLSQGGGVGMVLAVLGTYALVQFIQTYFLEPLIVGAGIGINPLFTIMSLVAAELLWGMPGMIIVMPVMGVIRVVAENVEVLHPLAYLISEKKKNNNSKAD